jgi:hypothetical protein
MKKKKTLDQLMREDVGRGVSPWPSDSMPTLSFTEHEWQWVDALFAADAHRDTQRLIALLSKSKVPDRVMPYLARLLESRVGRKPGRLALLPTRKAITKVLAVREVRDLVESGRPVNVAVKKVAPRWGLAVKTLGDFFSGRSGSGRKART